MNIGPQEILVVFLLALLIFGPKKLPEIGRGLGQAMREMKRMSSEMTSAFEDAMEGRTSGSSTSSPDYSASAAEDSDAGSETAKDSEQSPYKDGEDAAFGDEPDGDSAVSDPYAASGQTETASAASTYTNDGETAEPQPAERTVSK